ncbi:MAG: tRNA pseudouridine(38-40) synthase TruA [Puniceicoccales bacterium]|jgi:tRNA pseudouridine38-40 synthase|nr:tRNA pseudouridine(38-40) synthase TruA [Puniceicoccales bacterium]
MTRWCAHCAYEGTSFYGWQSQAGGNTIQDFIEARLAQLFHHPIRIHGSGRTDAGVHARDQVFHFDAGWNYGSDVLLKALSSGLPSGIQIWKIYPVTDTFHARYSVEWKRYIYYIHEGFPSPFQSRYVYGIGTRKLSLELLENFCSSLIGLHNFTTFGASHENPQENPTKNLLRLAFNRKGSSVEMTIEASGYLYKMARRIAGTAIEIALRRLMVEEVLQAFFHQKRTEKIVTAPAKGLFLDYVSYGENTYPTIDHPEYR